MSSWTISTITATKYSGYIWGIAIFQFLGIPQMQIAILWVLMIFDFFTGVWKAYRLNKQEITSHSAWLGAMKKVWTFILIFSLALVMKALELEPDWYIKTVISILIMSEFYSIIQNLYAMRTGKVIPEFDAISLLLKFIWEWVKNWLEKNLTNKGK